MKNFFLRIFFIQIAVILLLFTNNLYHASSEKKSTDITQASYTDLLTWALKVGFSETEARDMLKNEAGSTPNNSISHAAIIEKIIQQQLANLDEKTVAFVAIPTDEKSLTNILKTVKDTTKITLRGQLAELFGTQLPAKAQSEKLVSVQDDNNNIDYRDIAATFINTFEEVREKAQKIAPQRSKALSWIVSSKNITTTMLAVPRVIQAKKTPTLNQLNTLVDTIDPKKDYNTGLLRLALETGFTESETKELLDTDLTPIQHTAILERIIQQQLANIQEQTVTSIVVPKSDTYLQDLIKKIDKEKRKTQGDLAELFGITLSKKDTATQLTPKDRTVAKDLVNALEETRTALLELETERKAAFDAELIEKDVAVQPLALIKKRTPKTPKEIAQILRAQESTDTPKSSKKSTSDSKDQDDLEDQDDQDDQDEVTIKTPRKYKTSAKKVRRPSFRKSVSKKSE